MDVYRYIDRKYNAFPVADSIARHGYFDSEPLIAMRDDERHDGYTVIEGNRRLTALKALADPAVMAVMNEQRWKALPSHDELPPDFPVLIVESRESVASILGFRHVTGVLPWDPYQQARYVASLVDGESQLDAETVADLIGRSASEVRAFYRNLSIVEQANEHFHIPDTARIIDEFGVWTRAMSSTGIRDYIGAPPPREVIEREYPLDDDAGAPLGRLLVWLFGQPRAEAEIEEGTKSRRGRVIGDSRQLTRLGSVLANRDGKAALESGATLEVAERAALDERELFAAALAEAQEGVTLALKHRPRRTTKAIETALEKLSDDLRELRGEHGEETS